MAAPNSSLPQTFLMYCLISAAVAILACNSASSTLLHLSNSTDEFALLSFKYAIVTDPKDALSNWKATTTFCNWNGVSCSDRTQRVIALNLTGMSLAGTLSPNIANLSYLQTLDLLSNSLYGSLLVDFSRLTHLESLQLAGNQFAGLIPQSLGYCHRLQTMSMGGNRFHGDIPASLGSLQELRTLLLSRNNFTGTIPVAFANLSRLETLHLSYNSLQGSVPAEMRSLGRLKWFAATQNNLTGTVPVAIFNSSSLQVISMSKNRLQGRLPKDLGLLLPNIQTFYIAENSFHGVIPASLSNATRLKNLDLGTNRFEGPIPSELGSLQGLRIIYLAANMLVNAPNSREVSILASLSKCPVLEEVELSDNPLAGVLPASIGNLSSSLTRLNIFSNQIEGTIPSSISNLTNLIYLNMYDNRINGVIPPSIGALRRLQYLHLSKNMLEGHLPPQLYQLVNLGFLFISRNKFSGPISSAIGNITRLERLYIYSNLLSSTISPSLWELKNLEFLDLRENYFTGPLPPEVGNLPALYEMDLSANKLSGSLPVSLSKLQMLHYLNVSNNSFEGHIPEELDGMVNIKLLDLSYNSLTGTIPKSLEKLKNLQALNLSFNQLDGEIPSGGIFSNISWDSFLGNLALCGAPRFQVPICSDKNAKPQHKKVNVTRAVVSAVGVFAFLLVVGLLILMAIRRTRISKTQGSVPDFTRVEHPMISYREILQATNHFADANLLGTGGFGSVYKAILSNGETVAVKVFNLSFEGASRSFDIECNVMRQIRHKNLVKIITSCCTEDFRALVLQYMPQGSLENCLYSSIHQLNLWQMLNIMIDVACALDYLHYGFSEPIVHCDLKPNNVLLDDNMTAYIGDFGIARMLLGKKTSTLTTTLGSTGYIAPEFGSDGKVSTKADVFSYGILLLEMLTRKKPTDAMFVGDLSLRQWVAEALPDAILEVIDSHLQIESAGIGHDINEKQEGERRAVRNQLLVSIARIGLSCSLETPAERMAMVDVAAALKKMRERLQILEGH